MKFCPIDRYPNPPEATNCQSCGAPLGGRKKEKEKGKSVYPAEVVDRAPAPAPPVPADPVVVLGSPVSEAPALVRILEGGREADVYWLRSAETVIGRSEGEATFPDDPLLSTKHTSIRCDGTDAIVRDLKSRNGTFVRKSGKVKIEDGMEMMIGESLLRWSRQKAPKVEGTIELGEEAPAAGWLITVIRPGRSPLKTGFDGEMTIGRKGCDLALEDRFVSPLHAEVKSGRNDSHIVDKGSLNGIYYRIPPEQDVTVEPGGMVRAGHQVFRFSMKSR